MNEQLIHAVIELMAWMMSRTATSLATRSQARQIARRAGLGDLEARRLVRVADALTGPVAAEDE